MFQFLLYYLKSLRSWIEPKHNFEATVAKTAWTFVNDLYTEPSIVFKHEPESIACAVLFLALKMYDVQVPFAEEDGEMPWFKVFDGHLRFRDLKRICTEIVLVINKVS